MPARKRRRSRISKRLRGSLWLAGVVCFLVGLNMYVFLVRGGTSIGDVKRALAAARINPAQFEGAAAKSAPTAKRAVVKPTREPKLPLWQPFGKKEDVRPLLGRAGLSVAAADELWRLLARAPGFGEIRRGAISLMLDGPGHIASLELRAEDGRQFHVARDQDGKLRVRTDGRSRLGHDGAGHDVAGTPPRSRAP